MDDATLITRVSRAAETVDETGKRIALPHSISEAYQAALDRTLARLEREFFYGPPPPDPNAPVRYGDPAEGAKACVAAFENELRELHLHPAAIPEVLRAAAQDLLNNAAALEAKNASDGVPDR